MSLAEGFSVQVADQSHQRFADDICQLIERSAQDRGTGIAKRDPSYISQKIEEGKAVIALKDDAHLAGFCYIETWGGGEYVANSGLIVHPDYRGYGLAKHIKKRAFELTYEKFPGVKLMGLTTNPQVMRINTELGYRPVVFSNLTQDDQFWQGCASCQNYDILNRMKRKMCLCTAMLHDPGEK